MKFETQWLTVSICLAILLTVVYVSKDLEIRKNRERIAHLELALSTKTECNCAEFSSNVYYSNGYNLEKRTREALEEWENLKWHPGEMYQVDYERLLQEFDSLANERHMQEEYKRMEREENP